MLLLDATAVFALDVRCRVFFKQALFFLVTHDNRRKLALPQDPQYSMIVCASLVRDLTKQLSLVSKQKIYIVVTTDPRSTGQSGRRPVLQPIKIMGTFPPRACASCAQAASVFTTAIVTGRSKDKVYNFVGLDDVFYAGSHGLEIQGPSKKPVKCQVTNKQNAGFSRALCRNASCYKQTSYRLRETLMRCISCRRRAQSCYQSVSMVV